MEHTTCETRNRCSHFRHMKAHVSGQFSDAQSSNKNAAMWFVSSLTLKFRFTAELKSTAFLRAGPRSSARRCLGTDCRRWPFREMPPTGRWLTASCSAATTPATLVREPGPGDRESWRAAWGEGSRCQECSPNNSRKGPSPARWPKCYAWLVKRQVVGKVASRSLRVREKRQHAREPHCPKRR